MLELMLFSKTEFIKIFESNGAIPMVDPITEMATMAFGIVEEVGTLEK